jgi:hypothetical protein
VEFEAACTVRRRIHYLRDAAGVIVPGSAGDSGAEEVAWAGTVLQVACVMMPAHRLRDLWYTEMQRFALAAWARPQDVAGLADWITGSNVEPNGQVINHGRIAPDYATCTAWNLDALPLFALADLEAPGTQAQLLGPVYTALNALYTPGTATVIYPSPPVADWGTGQMLPFALADAQALVHGFDETGTAAAYLALHLDAQLAMQARHADGHTYAGPVEYTYEGGEEQIGLLAAQLRWTLHLRDQGLLSSVG